MQDDIEHQKKAKTVVTTVLDLVDKNKDGRISLEEFKAVGLDGLPNFDALGAEGHHYDVESGAYCFAMSLFFFTHTEPPSSLPRILFASRRYDRQGRRPGSP